MLEAFSVFVNQNIKPKNLMSRSTNNFDDRMGPYSHVGGGGGGGKHGSSVFVAQ